MIVITSAVNEIVDNDILDNFLFHQFKVLVSLMYFLKMRKQNIYHRTKNTESFFFSKKNVQPQWFDK